MNTSDPFRLDGKVAVITGAAGLLGEQHALALSGQGAIVVLSDLSEGVCGNRAKLISEQTGLPSISASCDVTDRQSWSSLLERVLDEFSRIDILVNNAAFTNQSPSKNYASSFEQFPVEDWDNILRVNLTGVFLGCQVVGAKMLEQRSGSIINIASLYGVVSPHHAIYAGAGVSQPPAYSVSKAGVIALTRYLGTLWAALGVRVNSITPGGVFNGQSDVFVERFSNLNPMQRMARPDEMRGALIYLASAASSHCAAHNLVVDGGWTAW